MAKYFDENGTEVEAFSEEELKGKQQEAIDTYLKENPDQSGDLKKAQDDLVVATAKIKEIEEAGGGNKDQKNRLLKERDEALIKVEEMKVSLMGEIKSLRENIYGSSKTKVLDKLAAGDMELKKKIEFEYDQFSGEPKNEVEIQQRLVKAYTLAKGSAPQPNFMDNMGGGGNRGEGTEHKVATGETDNGKAMRKALGISDEEAKKYTPPATQ